MSARWVMDALRSVFILIASEMQHSVADSGELADETLLRGNLLLHPDSAENVTTERCRTRSPFYAPNLAHASRFWLLTA